jgi:hypothetical protein
MRYLFFRRLLNSSAGKQNVLPSLELDPELKTRRLRHIPALLSGVYDPWS